MGMARFSSQILLFNRPKIWEHFGWRIVFLLVYILVICLFFWLKIQILNMTNLGKKEKTQQEGALNQSNKISKISKICPTIIVHNIIRD
jgi:predicted MFS family arabinose efflux permease